MFLVRWSGFGMVSPLVLIAAMLGATFLLRPYFQQTMPLYAAAYVANGIGLLVGAGINFLVANLFAKLFPEKTHSFMAFSMKGWSVVGVVCGIALLAYGYFKQ